MLSAITSKPDCRLHMETFRIRSLCVNSVESATLDSHEKALATSPCLHSLKCVAINNDDNNILAIGDMVEGVAPNLSKVAIVDGSALYQDMEFLHLKGHDTQQHWKSTETERARISAKMTHLFLDDFNFENWISNVRLTDHMPPAWFLRLDCSSLTTLELPGWSHFLVSEDQVLLVTSGSLENRILTHYSLTNGLNFQADLPHFVSSPSDLTIGSQNFPLGTRIHSLSPFLLSRY